MLCAFQGLDSPYSPRPRDIDERGGGGGAGGGGGGGGYMQDGPSQQPPLPPSQQQLGLMPSSQSLSNNGSDGGSYGDHGSSYSYGNPSNYLDDNGRVADSGGGGGGGRRGYVSRRTEDLIRAFAMCESAASLRQGFLPSHKSYSCLTLSSLNLSVICPNPHTKITRCPNYFHMDLSLPTIT